MKTIIIIVLGLVFLQIDSTVAGASSAIAGIPIWQLGLAAFGGTVVHILKKLKDMEAEGDMQFLLWGKKNLYKTLFGLAMALVTIWMMEDTGQMTLYAAFMTGYGGDSITMKKATNTKQ
ncbi:hypothetical protein JYU20_00445 [Bacteroidales bacterium AH-315-I05]|nr:hypothetical protein [Bacteroidales bacterium AH-315-I05]